MAAILLALGASGLAHAQAKASEAKPPDAKQPKVTLPEMKLPEMKFPEAPEVELENPKLPPELEALLAGSSGLEVKEKEADAPLTIQELANPKVRTASSRAESARDAPARVLTFTAEDLRARGYQELTELLDDLPGMDTIHSWSDTYFKSYWRGYRSELGDPFLLLVDGMEFNHLWLGEAQILAALPLSNVEQVEVLYGPASARYGPNAAMGIINVITRREEGSGTGVRTQLSVRSPERALTQGQVGDMTKVGDVSAFYVGQGFRVRLTGRFDLGVLDPALNERFEWLKNEYFENPSLWGEFLKYPTLAGSFRSPNEKQAVDARLILENRDDEGTLWGETEVAAQMYRLLTGSGILYAADRYQARPPWVMVEQSLSLRHQQSLSSLLRSTTRLRYRRSSIDSPSTALARDGMNGVVSLEYWQNASSSLGVGQDFNLFAGTDLALPSDELQLDFGLEYDRTSLDEGYSKSISKWDPATPFKDYEFPAPVTAGERMERQRNLDTVGAYLLPRYKFLENHVLHLGLRLDYNTVFKAEPTFRGGYVGQFLNKDLTVKVFYGQSVEQPGRRDTSDDSDDSGDGWEALAQELERSGTLEAGFDYSLPWLVLHGTAYYVHFNGSINEALEGIRRMVGVDLGATALIELEGIRQLRVWGYYSPYLLAQQSDPEDPAKLIPIGDLAHHKLLLGATLEANRFLSLTALGRCLSERALVSSNALSEEGPLPGYCVVDANLRVQHLFVEGLSLSLRGTNLLDTKYSHPGLYAANSDNTPGRWEGTRWIGSQGEYNSHMPQPGRAFSLQLALNL